MSENIKEIIERIKIYNGVYPKEELQILIDNQAETIPLLLDLLRDVNDLLDKMIEDFNYVLPLYAPLILAQFRETQAYPLIYKIFSSDKDKVKKAFGDFITEELSRVLASVCGEDVSLINRLIEDEDAHEYVRGAGMNAWLCLVRAGVKTRGEAIAYYKTLFDQPSEEDSFLRGCLISNCLDLSARELLPEIKKSFDENLVALYVAGDWKAVSQEMEKGESLFLDGRRSEYDLVTDMISDLGSWASFQPKESPAAAQSSISVPKSLPAQTARGTDRGVTFIRDMPKIGPNAPCLCGSGRKYKKCCQNKN